MSLPTLSTVQKLQKALHAKAKGEPNFRFYALYDKVYRKDVLWSAWRRCLTNGGKPGVDGQTFADIEVYGVTKWLDTIPHNELLQCMARRVSDKATLHLIKMWLIAPVEERTARGHVVRTTRNKDEGRGSPQGAPISPLLANLYMRRFLLGWKTLHYERKLKARIVNYADDFVICCRGTGEQAHAVMRDMMSRLKLTVNETKTKLCRVPDEPFDFLGYTFGRCYSPRTGHAYIGTTPMRKKVRRLCDSLREETKRRKTLLDEEESIRCRVRGRNSTLTPISMTR